MRTITAVAIGFVLILLFGIGTYMYVNTSANQLSGQLKIAESSIRSQNWGQAGEQLAYVEKSWDKSKGWWTILLDHQEIDNIDVSLKRLSQYVKSQGSTLALGEISALELLVDHIADKEAPNIKNIL